MHLVNMLSAQSMKSGSWQYSQVNLCTLTAAALISFFFCNGGMRVKKKKSKVSVYLYGFLVQLFFCTWLQQ